MASRELPAELLAGCAGSTLHLWDAAPGRPLGGTRVVPHASPLGATAWNRNNKVVAGGGADGMVQLSYSNGKVMSVLPRDAMPAAAPGPVTSLSWSVGSKCLAAGSSNGSVYVHDIRAKSYLELSGHAGGVTGVQYQDDDQYLAVASASGGVALYSHQLEAGAAPAARLAPPPAAGPLACLSCSAGEVVLAAGSATGTVAVWEVAAGGRLLETYGGQHAGGCTALAFLPLKPKFLYSAGADGRVCLQDRRTQGARHWIAAGAPLTALSVREDHSCLAVGRADGTVLLYDPRNSTRPLHTLRCGTGSEPVTSLHWQHIHPSVTAKLRAVGAAAPAAQPAAAQPAVPQPAAPVPKPPQSNSTVLPVPIAAPRPAPAVTPAALGATAVPAAPAAATAPAAVAVPPPPAAPVAPAASTAAGPTGTGLVAAAQQPAAAMPAAAPAPPRAAMPAHHEQQAATPPLPAAPAPVELAISPLSSMAPHRAPAAAPAAASPTHVTPVQPAAARQQLVPAPLAITPLDGVAAAAVPPAASAAESPVVQLAPAVPLNISPLSSIDCSSYARPVLSAAAAAATMTQRTPASAAALPPLEISPLSSMRPPPGARPAALRETTNSPRPSPHGHAMPLSHTRSASLAQPSPGTSACNAQQPTSSFQTAASSPAAVSAAAGQLAMEVEVEEAAEPAHAPAKEKDPGPAAFAGRSPAAVPQHEASMAGWSIKAQQAAVVQQSPPPHEFSFAAAQRSREVLATGGPAAAVQQAGAGLDPGLRDDILAMHLDMLNQFQAQQEQIGALVAAVVARQDELAAEMAGLRKQLGRMLRRRDQDYLWL